MADKAARIDWDRILKDGNIKINCPSSQTELVFNVADKTAVDVARELELMAWIITMVTTAENKAEGEDGTYTLSFKVNKDEFVPFVSPSLEQKEGDGGIEDGWFSAIRMTSEVATITEGEHKRVEVHIPTRVAKILQSGKTFGQGMAEMHRDDEERFQKLVDDGKLEV